MIVIIGLFVFVFIIGIVIYNSLIGKRNQVTNAFSAIDVMLKKRFDLIPNLVEIVKQYTNYEQSTLTKIVELRARATSGNLTDGEKASLDTELSSAVKGLMITVENYPDLKANTNFLNLQSTWTESEEQIAAARRTYNASVTFIWSCFGDFTCWIIHSICCFGYYWLFSSFSNRNCNVFSNRR